jgi:hypothetical protein
MGDDRSNAGLLGDQQRATNRGLQHVNTDVKPLVIGGDGRQALSRMKSVSDLWVTSAARRSMAS